MFKISSLISLFTIFSYIPIAGGFLIKKNKYENNYLITMNNYYEKIILHKNSFQKLNLKTEDYFSFKFKNQIKKVKIHEIKNNGEFYELIFEKISEYPYLKDTENNVSYFLETKTL